MEKSTFNLIVVIAILLVGFGLVIIGVILGESGKEYSPSSLSLEEQANLYAECFKVAKQIASSGEPYSLDAGVISQAIAAYSIHQAMVISSK